MPWKFGGVKYQNYRPSKAKRATKRLTPVKESPVFPRLSPRKRASPAKFRRPQPPTNITASNVPRMLNVHVGFGRQGLVPTWSVPRNRVKLQGIVNAAQKEYMARKHKVGPREPNTVNANFVRNYNEALRELYAAHLKQLNMLNNARKLSPSSQLSRSLDRYVQAMMKSMRRSR